MLNNIFGSAQSSRRRDAIVQQSARVCLFIFAVAILLAACTRFQQLGAKSRPRVLHERAITPLESSDDNCRMVHNSKDQCSFIKKHCPTDEAGFAAYLDLYFCQLQHVKPIAFIILTLWLCLLFSTIGIASSDFFCVDLSTMADILGMSESLAGVTLLAFGNGSPDVFSTFAAMSTDSGDLAIGELMGAAGFITAVVAGSMALIKPFKVSKKSFIRDVGFFTAASAFSMIILADGLLHLWECLAMICFYLFYVGFVLFWHMVERRRERQAGIEAAARSHYIAAGNGDDIEPYRDDPEDSLDRRSQPRATTRGASTDDFAALERRGGDEDDDYDDEERDRWMSELNTNMRLSRTAARPRSATIAPVRPSLVGALEFQAVLKSLHKSQNMQHLPLNPRRYSDDPNLVLSHPHGRQIVHKKTSLKNDSPSASRPHLQVDITADTSAGQSAYTANDPIRDVDSDLQWRGQSHSTTSSTRPEISSPLHDTTKNKHHVAFQAPSIQITHHSPEGGSLEPATSHNLASHIVQPRRPQDLQTSKSEDMFGHRKLLRNLNSPSVSPILTGLQHHIVLPSPPQSRSATRSGRALQSPETRLQQQSSNESAPELPSLALPPRVVTSSPEQISFSDLPDMPGLFSSEATQWRYWPYRLLPPPEILACVLFPTISDWHEKSVWAKILGLVAAPSVFLLTVTLPVVESDKLLMEAEASPILSRTNSGLQTVKGTLLAADQSDQYHDVGETDSNGILSRNHNGTTKPVNTDIATPRLQLGRTNSSVTIVPAESGGLSQSQHQSDTSDWPRWLLLIQLYTAPFIIVLSVYLQSPDLPPLRWLLRPSLVCLLISTLLLIPVLLTTSPVYRPPPYRWILSIAGFIVSIAWISTIASQVVGTLKALAIILNWSNAIMGLTIFAVGNSVSDLVADVTVANLGYPVMALSACFGGPMLNILLGIGLSGTYSILRGADRRKHKHPKQKYRLKTFHLDVDRTLTVSGVALLITLVGLLVLVPLNKWMMTRKIGSGLIIIWILTTIANVVLEVSGFADIRLASWS